MGIQSDLIDRLKGRLFISSDYAIAQRWQIEPTRISQYRRNRLRKPIRFIIDIAEETGVDPLFILKSLELERAQRKGEDIAKKMLWRPNEKVRRYPPDWVKRRNYHQKLAND